MAKVSYANLKLKPINTTSAFEFGGQQVEVLNYLPIEDKYDLVMITLQKAEENGIYNPILLDLYFHLHLVYMYTNLSFTDKQKENELKIYDTLVSNGFFDKFFETMDENEYKELMDYIEELKEAILYYKNSAGAVLQSIIQDLPENAQAAADIVKNFDPKQYQAVIDFTTAANGGRNINTNQ
jgi:hypothetical protein